MRLLWRGSEVTDDVLRKVVAPAMAEIGLRVEGLAKSKLKKSAMLPKSTRRGGRYVKAAQRWIPGGGRGLRTGTLRRSIHTATPGYGWAGDDVEPSAKTPERGGSAAQPSIRDFKATVQVGSGLRYARWVHDLHYNPEVHRFIERSAEEIRPYVRGIVRKHRQAGGFS